MAPGESAKTLTTAETLLRGLAAAGMDHDDHVAALGGGVVGDVAGFCAAVYQRGVGVVQVPTTLVAQVDSAYGGKTGVDLPEGKNYVGAYHQPRAVLADPRTLATLPPEELAAGWAEVIKTALIAGGPLWARVRRGEGIVDRDLVLACARTKLAVVARDERDQGRRQVLNLGHTVGPRDRDRDGLFALPPRRGRRARPAGGADAVRPARPALGGERAARRARSADRAGSRRRPRSGAGRRPARQEAPRRPRRASCWSRRRATCGPARLWPNATCERRWRGCDEEPRRDPARHQPRRARAAPRAALRRADVHPARAAGSRSSRASWTCRRTSSSPTTRARTSRSCTRRATTPTACC